MDRAELARLLGAEMAVAEPRDVVIAEREPERFMAAFADAVAAGGRVFLADPAWGEAERAQFNAIVHAPTHGPAGEAHDGWLCIPTGGSSGRIKLARHDQDTIHAAVRGFCEHFELSRVNAIGLLPLHHVSGFMAWMRCVLTGGSYVSSDWKKLAAGERRAVARDDCFLSLVPTQLQRLLTEPEAVEWLRGLKAIFIGGGPAWPGLIEAGATAGLPLSFTFGMTETAAMVAALRPTEFLAGQRGCGRALPHARVTLDEQGVIVVAASSLFRGYYPEHRSPEAWTTADVGRFDENGSLHVLARCDALIITGGEKVDPNEVEAALRASGEFSDVAVIGLADPDWGEVVAACYPAEGRTPDLARVEAALRQVLARHKHPKHFVPIAPWPRNAQGKLSREALRRIASAAVHPPRERSR